MKNLICNRYKTPDGTILESRSIYDFVSHVDKVSGEYYFVDGGLSYSRRSVNKEPMQDLCVYNTDPFELQRESFKWKSYGKNGEFPEGKISCLKDLTDEHIVAILQTQRKVQGTYIETLFRNELVYRGVIY